MRLKWSKGISLLAVAAMISMIPSGLALANCTNQGIVVLQGVTNHIVNCGPAPTTFIWMHGRGVQGVIGSDIGTVNQGNTITGHDSGNRSGLGETFSDFGAPEEYLASGDPGNPGWDGCIQNLPEPQGCVAGGANYGPMDYVMAGVDPAFPNIAKMFAVSVDFNEILNGWLVDQAGAANIDGNSCGENALAGNPANFSCAPIPVPMITGSSPAAGGVNINLSIGSTAGIQILDDCLIAEDRATNCPRNLYVGRVLMYRHGGCTSAGAATLSRNTFVYPATPASGTLNVTDRWSVYSVEDGNLNGVLDAGEDGSNGGTANSVLDPFVIAGTNAATPIVRVPTVSGATDCIFFGLAIGLDNNKLGINPAPSTIFGEMVLSPMVTLNPNPVRSGTGTPVADLVTVIHANKSQGKGIVDWETGIEMSTAGFNVIGTKKGGAEVKLNGSLIAAKEGTSGKGATYSVTFDAGQLKGSSAVFVEIVKTDGSKERFGPVSF
jgi:hypothetical protein